MHEREVTKKSVESAEAMSQLQQLGTNNQHGNDRALWTWSREQYFQISQLNICMCSFYFAL